MDRQPLTDRLGDRLLAEYGGAAAAYSLRALNGNGDNVVRVRRASDNDEKDFTAEQIELGEMVNWVNSQTVPPLDIGVETSEGRIPVPEGGTSIGTPAAAYSLRNLSTTYTGNVVDVRRSSDDAEESFTAEEVSDGTLEAWVLAPVSSLVGNRMYFDGVNDYVTLTSSFTLSSGSGFSLSGTIIPMLEGIGDGLFGDSSVPNTGFWIGTNGSVSLTNDAGTFSVITSAGFFEKGKIQEFTIFENGSGNWAITVNGVTTNTTKAVTDVTIDRIGSSRARLLKGTIYDISYSLNGTPVYSYLGYDNTNGGWEDQVASNDGTVTGSPELFTGQGFDGTVSKWYDQSGNDNHATQTTPANQPKIVDGGSLVAGGIDFGGDDDGLVADSLASSFSGDAIPIAAFSVSQVSSNAESAQAVWRFSSSSSSQPLKQWQYRSLGYGLIYRADSGTNINDLNAGSYSVNEEYLHTIIVNDSEVMNGYENGTLLSRIDSIDANIGTISLNQFKMNPHPYGTLREVILYNTDQSDNRTGIEGNIKSQYNIS